MPSSDLRTARAEIERAQYLLESLHPDLSVDQSDGFIRHLDAAAAAIDRLIAAEQHTAAVARVVRERSEPSTERRPVATGDDRLWRKP